MAVVHRPSLDQPASERVWVIANPAAGRGSSTERLAQVREEAERRGLIRFAQTHAPGDEAILTGQAIAAGADVILAVGGDGTCSRVANAIVDSGRDCRLAVVPTGTGNDFAKTLGVENLAANEILDLIQRRDAIRMDLGRVDGYHFLNSCGVGFDASVLEASNNVAFLKGNAVYIYSALAQLFTYRGLDVAINGAAPARMLMITISNGRMLGGAFRIAPTASVLDGKLDVVYIANCSLLQRVRVFTGAVRGTHLGLAAVRSEKRKGLALEFSAPPAMEVDGELRRGNTRSVSIECVPRALSVIAAPGALV